MPLLERIAPARLGRPFRLVLASAVITNLGDGVTLAAGPLLVASQTSDPVLVSSAVLVQQLPALVVGLFAGVLVDRVDRLRIVVVGNVCQALVVASLATSVLTGTVSIGVVLVTMFLLGLADTLVSLASGTLLPAIVAPQDLGLANARSMGAFLTCNQLLGPPLGAFLFAAGHAWPFLTDAVTFVLAALLVARLRLPAPEPTQRTSVLADAREGLAWLWRHAAMRTLVVTITLFNVTWAAAWAVLVLWARDQVGLDAVGFGLLTTVGGIGGLLTTSAYGWLTSRWSEALLMKVCLTTEVVMHLVMAVTHTPWVAFVTMFGFGMYAFVWATVSSTIRQRAVPDELRGRVGAVNMLGIRLGMVIGTPLGGVIAGWGGVSAPFWFAFVGAGLTLLAVWRQLDHVAHA